MGRRGRTSPFVFILLFSLTCIWMTGAKKPTKPPSIKTTRSPAEIAAEKRILSRIKSAPKSKVIKAKVKAAQVLQADLVRIFDAMSKDNERIPAHVRRDARAAWVASKSGYFTTAIERSLSTIVREATDKDFQEAGPQQFQGVLRAVIPFVPGNPGIPGIANAVPGGGGSFVGSGRLPLQGLLDFLTQNLNALNVLLNRTMGAATNGLVGGAVKSLTGTIAGATEGVRLSVGGLGPVLGDLLSMVT